MRLESLFNSLIVVGAIEQGKSIVITDDGIRVGTKGCGKALHMIVTRDYRMVSKLRASNEDMVITRDGVQAVRVIDDKAR